MPEEKTLDELREFIRIHQLKIRVSDDDDPQVIQGKIDAKLEERENSEPENSTGDESENINSEPENSTGDESENINSEPENSTGDESENVDSESTGSESEAPKDNAKVPNKKLVVKKDEPLKELPSVEEAGNKGYPKGLTIRGCYGNYETSAKKNKKCISCWFSQNCKLA